MFKRLLKKIRNEIVQDVPSELEECLVCGKIECSNEKWLHCKNRISHMKKRNAHRECPGKSDTKA